MEQFSPSSFSVTLGYQDIVEWSAAFSGFAVGLGGS